MIRFFILAGGYGKRAMPLTLNLPKPLFPLAGKSIIVRQLDQLIKKGIKKGFVNLHYKGEKIRESVSDYDLELINEEKLSGSSVLREIADCGSEMVLAVNGDTYLEIPLTEMIKKMEESRADGVLSVLKNKKGYASLEISGDRYCGIMNEKYTSATIYAGVALFRTDLLKNFNEVNFFDTLKRLNANIRVVEYKGLWLEVGTPELYYKANSDFCSFYGIKDGNSLSEGVRILPGAIVKNSILWKGSKAGTQVNLDRCILTEKVNPSPGIYKNKIITSRGIQNLDI